MKRERIGYLIITLLFFICVFLILKQTDLGNNVMLSKSLEVIIILFLIRISYGCTLYIRYLYQKQKYSYSIIMNLGLVLFLNINILRHINLLIVNWNTMNITDIYNSTVNSFSYFAYIILPFIVILSIYSIITNIILIKKEGFRPKNLLGIILGVFALLGLFGSQGIYLLTSSLLKGKELMVVKKLMDVVINASLSYFYTIIIATLYCNIMAARHTPKYDKDYVIILGCMVGKDGSLTPLLKSRVDKAIEFAKKQKEETGKDIIFIPSGGKGKDEVISEAEAMKKYLLKQGIKRKNIIIENKSTSTIENMKYSNSIIIKAKKDAKISFSTTNYHVFRSGVIASNMGIDCEGMGSKTKWYYYTNALIREFVANVVQEKKKHVGILVIINISAIVLLLIGHYYHIIDLTLID